jgi:hypothetical protein
LSENPPTQREMISCETPYNDDCINVQYQLWQTLMADIFSDYLMMR